jgi:hypothetical protein
MRTKAKVTFVQFLRPDGYWPYPYSVEQAFEVFRWMVRTGASYEQRARWGRRGVIELLSCQPSCVNFGSVKPIRSLEDLRRRFHYALLSAEGNTTVTSWRHDTGLTLDATRWLHFRHAKPFTAESVSRDELERFYRDGSTQRLTVSPNRVHTTAVTCKWTEIFVEPDKFSFLLHYGWPEEECSSRWNVELTATQHGETFTEGLRRAIRILAEMTGQEVG